MKLTRFLRGSRSPLGALAWGHGHGFSSHNPLPAFIFSSSVPWEDILGARELPLLQHSWLCLWASFHGVAAATRSTTDGIGWWCLSVSTTFSLKSKVHLCVQRWRDIHGLSLCRKGLLSSIQTFFISRRVKIWSGRQNATNMYMLLKWFRPERHMSASLRSHCKVKLLRNIDFETDVFLPWHHQFLKNMSLSQQSPLSQP